MRAPNTLLRKANWKRLQRPTVLAEHDTLAREAARRDASDDAFRLTLTELAVATRTATAIAARIRAAAFPVVTEVDAVDCTATPSAPTRTGLERARGGGVDRRTHGCRIGGSGTGKTHLATALGRSRCRLGETVRCVTAAGLGTALEEAHPPHRLDRPLTALDRLALLRVDEWGDRSFRRSGAERLCPVFADRSERRSRLITSNRPFGEWGTVFQGERMTAALLDRLTHQCDILELTGESDRVRESMPAKQAQTGRTATTTKAKK